jgi:nucleotide-binding universal stress UspA family protein
MYQKILIAVDGSATSDSALEEAIKLAQRLDSRIAIMYVLEDILYWKEENYIDYAELQASIKASGEKMLAKAEMLAQRASVAAETKLVEAAGGGRVASIIVAEAEHWQAELIVIGTHGRSGVSRLLLGSVAENVVRSAPMPVLLIRNH